MIKDITIGQYYPENSILHRLDPRTKIILTFAYIIMLFVFRNALQYLIIGLFVGICIWLSKVPPSYIFRGLKPVMVILMMTVVMNMFFTKGEHVLFNYGIIVVSVEGIKNAILFGTRLVLLVIGSALMTFTTTPNRLTDGLESVMAPLKIFKAPVGDVAMMMTIALRFVPILVDETDRIMKAQKARGADFENGSIARRIKSMIPLLIPLFVAAFKRAEDLAQAMESRCYTGGNNRTKMKPLKYSLSDAGAYGVCIMLLAVLIVIRIAV